MKEGTARALRAATIAVFVAVVVVAAVAGWRTLNPGPTIRQPDLQRGEVSVARSIDVATRAPLTVRGFVFKGPGGLGLRLCDGFRREDPPKCRGPFLDLDRVNEGSFALEEGETDDGPILWNDDSIALRGTVVGTRMTVEQVLR